LIRWPLVLTLKQTSSVTTVRLTTPTRDLFV